jgi:nicotinamide mononucleotide (NMN) deamidase PncC
MAPETFSSIRQKMKKQPPKEEPKAKRVSREGSTRKAERVARRLAAAARRKASTDYTHPITGKTARKGTTAHRQSMIGRAMAAHKIEKKRLQRRSFSALSAAEKAEHRAAGRDHRTPRDLAR